MKTASSVIAQSSYVQEFLKEREITAFYGKAESVSEIVRKAVYPVVSADCLIALNNDGNYYRFLGGLSNLSCNNLYETFRDAGSAFTIIKLDKNYFFCYNTPVYDTSGQSPVRIGSMVMLSDLGKTRRLLENTNILKDVNIAVIVDGAVMLSNDRAVENTAETELSSKRPHACTAKGYF